MPFLAILAGKGIAVPEPKSLASLVQSSKDNEMEAHYHFTAISAIAVIALVLAVFGTAHLIALTYDNRASRALISLGF